MSIKKFKYLYQRANLKKYIKLINDNAINLPKKIERNILLLESYKDNTSLIKSIQKNIENGIFYYIIFSKKKQLNKFKIDLISQIVDFFGVHVFFLGDKYYYYLYQNIIQEKGLKILSQKNVDKRFIFLEEENLNDLTYLSVCYLIEHAIIFTNSKNEELMQNFSNTTFSILINIDGKIFKPIVFDDIIELKNNILKLNYQELEFLKNEIKQKDLFAEKILNLINK